MSAITAPLRKSAAVRPSKLQQRSRLRIAHRAAGDEPFPFRVHIGLLLEWDLKQTSNRLLVGVCEIVAISGLPVRDRDPSGLKFVQARKAPLHGRVVLPCGLHLGCNSSLDTLIGG